MKKHRLLSALLSAVLGVACIAAPVPQKASNLAVNELTADALEETRVYTTVNQIRYTVSLDNQTAKVTGYFGYATELVIPSSITYEITDDYSVELPVTGFNISGYYETYEGEPGNLYQIKKVTLPGSMESLEYTFQSFGTGAKGRWDSLEEIVIEDGVKSIGFGLFYNAIKVRKVTIPASVTLMDSDAFYLDPSRTIKNYRELGGVIYGYSGSTAEGFARYNSIPFIPLDDTASTTTTTTTSTTTTTTTTSTTTTAVTPTLPDLEISASAITLEEGEQYTITANQTGLSYRSNNTDVAVVSSKGVVTALGEGTALISVVNADGDVAQLRVTVTAIAGQTTAPPSTTTTTTTTKTTTTTTTKATTASTTATTSTTTTTTAPNDDPYEEYLLGDCNLDGRFNLADVVYLQKWLLAVPDIHLANWKAADFCEDGRLDVFDLCLMKRALLSSYYGY